MRFQAEHEVLAALAATNSPIDKQQILQSRSTETLKDMFYHAYNPSFNYWVTSGTITVLTKGDDQADWLRFKAILSSLKDRRVTGGDAITMVQVCLNHCSSEDAELLLRILDHDMKVGVGIQTLLNVYGEDFIPTFEVMKARKWDDSKNISPVFPCFIEPKLDGVRCFAIKQGPTVTLWSRRGHVFENYPQIVKELAEIPGDYVYDGELVSKQSFNATMSQVRRKYDVDTTGTLFTIFDGFELEHLESGRRTGHIVVPFAARRAHLVQRIEPYVGNTLELVECFSAGTKQIAEDFYEMFLKRGFEGAMLKAPHEFYHFKRHKGWLKLKPTDTLDLVIVNFQEGEGKYVGMLGALVVELDVRVPGKVEPQTYYVNVGGGFSDEERVKIWNNRPQYLGKLAEVIYDRVTTNDSGGYSLRFPRFKCIRDDKNESDIVIL